MNRYAVIPARAKDYQKPIPPDPAALGEVFPRDGGDFGLRIEEGNKPRSHRTKGDVEE
jgi:hypothetical protein